ncbi:hypothetical protein L195_g063951, partial [Trifolium pratense]
VSSDVGKVVAASSSVSDVLADIKSSITTLIDSTITLVLLL